MKIISILTTTSGIFGLLITILAIFFKPSKIKEIPIKPLVIIIMWLALTVLGCVNLYYTLKCDDTISDDTISDDAISDDMISNSTVSDGTFDSVKFIKDNYDLIQKLKASYSKEDTEIIEDDEVDFKIIEKAGIVYRDLKKTETSHLLVGNYVASAKVIILDYSSDDILYEYTSEKNIIHYAPGNSDKFYCVVTHDDYDLYVTPPIQAVGGESSDNVKIYLDKKGIKYTPLSQIHLYMRNPKSDEPYVPISSDYFIGLSCVNINDGNLSSFYQIETLPDSEVLLFGGYSYFSLNTDYELDISLYHQSDESSELAHETFNGFIPDSNIAEIVFELDNKNNTPE